MVDPGSLFEMPKSSTLSSGVPSAPRVRKRFAGLRSRWTMPSACASASASQACEHHVDDLPDRQLLAREARRDRRPRGTPSPCTARRSRACRRRARARRARFEPHGGARLAQEALDDLLRSPSTSGSRNLIATGWSSCRCVAATTTPMPPWPSTRSTRYLPANTDPIGTIGMTVVNGLAARNDSLSRLRTVPRHRRPRRRDPVSARSAHLRAAARLHVGLSGTGPRRRQSRRPPWPRTPSTAFLSNDRR